MPTNQTTSGYVPCACRDCFETAIGELGQALCHDCEEHGCEAGAEAECCSPHAYGGEAEGCEFEACDEARIAGCDYCATHEAEHQANIAATTK